MEPSFTEWLWKNPDVKRFLQVPKYPCSLFGAKACSFGQKLLTLRVIYYYLLKLHIPVGEAIIQRLEERREVVKPVIIQPQDNMHEMCYPFCATTCESGPVAVGMRWPGSWVKTCVQYMVTSSRSLPGISRPSRTLPRSRDHLVSIRLSEAPRPFSCVPL